MSKNAVNALTREQQKLFSKEDRHVVVHAVNPGDVSSDMNPSGAHSAVEGTYFEEFKLFHIFLLT
jgi:hypothetical protein